MQEPAQLDLNFEECQLSPSPSSVNCFEDFEVNIVSLGVNC